MSQIEYPPSPLHDKMAGLETERNTVQEFLDWLQANGYWICKQDENDRFWPTFKSNEKIIANFFDIDLNAFYAEKDALLAAIRKAQEI